MERNYEQVREDLKNYFNSGAMTKSSFCDQYNVSNATLWRFLSGSHMGDKRRNHIVDEASKLLYGNDKIKKPVSMAIEEIEVVEEITLDETITKLIDKKIEETMKQIAELESKVKNLEASRDILKELLD